MNGVLSSSGNGLVMINEVPAVADIFILESVSLSLVASTTSAADGTWSVSGLDETKKYSVIARAADGEEFISGNVAPVV